MLGFLFLTSHFSHLPLTLCLGVKGLTSRAGGGAGSRGGEVPARTAIYPVIKRVLDVWVSALLIVLLLPVWAGAAIAVKLSSPGPVFFRQPRSGRSGRPFTILKYRTMRTDHAHDPAEIVPLSHPGITAVGRFLRRTKIDELPQLFHVLVGDMSLVGPRPTIPEQVERYDAFQRRRLEVRPGISGLAQVNGNAALSWEERIRYDVYYVDQCSFRLDLGILVKMIAVIVLGEQRYARPFAQSPYAARAGRAAADPSAARRSGKIEVKSDQ